MANYRLTALPLFLAGTFLALPVQAQDSLQLDVTGRVAIGLSDPDDPVFDNFNYATLDVEGELALTSDGAFGLGFDVFVLGDFEFEPQEYLDLYLYYNFGSGQVQVGHAQSAIDLFLPQHPLTFGGRTQDSLGVEAFLHATFVRNLSFGDDPALGVSYFGDYGRIGAAASVHFNQDGDGTVFALAALYNITPGIEVFGGTEFVETDSADPDPRFWLGGRYDENGVLVEGIYSTGVAFSPDIENFELNAQYEIPGLENLTVGASVFWQSFSGSTFAFQQLGVEYVADNGLGIGANLNATDGELDSVGIEASFSF